MQVLVCVGMVAVFVLAAAFVLACGKVIDPEEQLLLRVRVDSETSAPRALEGGWR